VIIDCTWDVAAISWKEEKRVGRQTGAPPRKSQLRDRKQQLLPAAEAAGPPTRTEDARTRGEGTSESFEYAKGAEGPAKCLDSDYAKRTPGNPIAAENPANGALFFFFFFF